MRLRYRHQFRDKLDKGDVGAACSTLTDRLTQVGISTGNLDDNHDIIMKIMILIMITMKVIIMIVRDDDHDNRENYDYDCL